jgi:hypothetical protein
MGFLEVIARAKIRPGQLEGVKTQAAEIVRLTRGTECEVHEMFTDEQGLLEHQMHIMEARTVLFRDYAYDHRSTVYGEASQNFINLIKARMGAAPTTFSFVQGLEQSARV